MQLPVLGSVIQLHRADSRYPHVAMAKLAQTYGDIMSFGFGMQTAGTNLFSITLWQLIIKFLVVCSSFESMKNIFQRVDANSHRYEFPYVFDRNYGKNLGKNL